MAHAPTKPHLLESLYDIGEQMREALEKDDLQAYFDLLDKRGMLLETLQSYKHATEVAPDWMQWGKALADQHQVLSAAIEKQEMRLNALLLTTGRYREAQQRYLSRPPRDGMLNKNLHG